MGWTLTRLDLEVASNLCFNFFHKSFIKYNFDNDLFNQFRDEDFDGHIFLENFSAFQSIGINRFDYILLTLFSNKAYIGKASD